MSRRKKGAKAVYEVVEKGISDAILNLQPSVSLEEIGGYEEPEVTSEDETLIKLCDSMNKAAGVVITYQFGDATETLSGDRIHEWLVPNADGTVGVDSGKVNAYVKELADKYNTNNKAKNLKTSYGKTVTIRGGTYGWKINQSAEADELASFPADGFLIRNQESFHFFRELRFDKTVILDHNLYVFNRYAKEFWKRQGVCQFTAPLELNESELESLGCRTVRWSHTGIFRSWSARDVSESIQRHVPERPGGPL